MRELKAEHDMQTHFNSTLEGKGSQLVRSCGIVIPLLLAAGTFLSGRIGRNHELENLLGILLLIILVLTIASMFYSVRAQRIKLYTQFHPVDFKSFIDAQGKSNQNVKDVGKMDVGDFYDYMIYSHLKSNMSNTETNAKKASKIRIAQYLFLIGLSIVPVLVGVLFFLPPMAT